MGALVLAAALAAAPGLAHAQSATAVPGKPALLLGDYDLAALGYRTEEFFVRGEASAYQLGGEATSDGVWTARPEKRASYTTRLVVARPADPARFNGTVVVEWLNVTAGTDAAPEWTMTHRDLMREGYAWIGVSAQQVGVEGGAGISPMARPLKALDPARYGSLSHPGDAFAHDIFSQAGRLARGGDLLGPLKPQRVIAAGESQSAMYLVTYLNAVDPLARVFDGFLVHSRWGPAARLDGASTIAAAPGSLPQDVRLRPDLRAPVMVVLTETDVIGARLPGVAAARQPDTARLRTWEIAGAAHADTYLSGVGRIDAPTTPLPQIAAAYRPAKTFAGAPVDKPVNAGPQHHYVVQAALAGLDRWIRTGEAPPKAEPLALASTRPPALARDENGLAKGGVRTPWVEAPVALLSGVGNSGSVVASMAGVTETFDQSRLDRLYPGGRRDYLRRFEAALDRSIRAGFLRPADRQEILALAELMYPGAR